MKTIKLISKIETIEGKEIIFRAVDMLHTALEFYEPNRKGLSRINRILKIIDCLDKAVKEEKDTIEIEDNDFDIIFESMDNASWGPVAFRFGEFFKMIQDVKSSS